MHLSIIQQIIYSFLSLNANVLVYVLEIDPIYANDS